METVKNKFKKFLSQLAKYRYPVVGILIVALFGFTVWRIDYLSAPERDEESYNEQLTTVDSVNFDDEAIEAILELKDTDVEVRPNFPGGRTNPF